MANPYNFVSFPATISRAKMTNHHHRFQGKTGIIQCKLEVKTELCIKGSNDKPFWSVTQDPDTVFIPGTSLRGMIRTVCETIGGGCGYMFSQSYGPYKKSRIEKYRVVNCKYPSNDLEPCVDKIVRKLTGKTDEQKKQLLSQGFEICPVCSLLGLIAGEFIYKSRVSFTDTDTTKNKDVSLSALKILFSNPGRQPSPQPHHQSFYFQPSSYSTGYTTKQQGKFTIRTYEGGTYNGRKFYLHSDNINQTGDKEVAVVNPDACFFFNVEFENLTDDELSLLLFSLVLEDGWCHKLGYGKPWGLGSIKISIESLKILNAEYFEDFSQSRFVDAIKDVDRMVKNFLEKLKKESYYDDLKTVMEFKSEMHAYPTRSEFNAHPDWNIAQFNASVRPRSKAETLKNNVLKVVVNLSPPKHKTIQPKSEEAQVVVSKLTKNKVYIQYNEQELVVSNPPSYPPPRIGDKYKVRVDTDSEGDTKIIFKGRV